MKPLATALAALLLSTAAAAAGGTIHFDNRDAARAAADIPIPTASAFRVNRLAPPRIDAIRADLTASLKSAGSDGGATARANGSFGIPYTSTRVATGTSKFSSTVGRNWLSTTYPYRAVGLLGFRTPFGNAICTASVIRRGVIVTAAHCIQDYGDGATRYSDFRFAPGYWGVPGSTAQQRAPYGIWNWKSIAVPTVWSNGTDVGNGSAVNNDLAVIAVSPNAAGKFIGDVVGKLGYGWNNYGFVKSARTGNVSVAAVTTLGYPGLLDGGAWMQRTDGPTYLTTVSSALQMMQGSDFTGGSSGGPWIVNFAASLPTRTGGAVIGGSAALKVIGVTSWGASDPNAPKDNYASRFGQNPAFPSASYGRYGAGNIGGLLNALCSRKPAGSAKTLAELGYCN